MLGVEKEFVLGLFPVALMNPEGAADGDDIMDCDEKILKIEGGPIALQEESKRTAAHNARASQLTIAKRKDPSQSKQASERF